MASRAWAQILQTWNVNARFAADASQAIALLDEGFIPQAIFCDQRLRSGESGFEILQLLLSRCPNAHGAMISGEFNSPHLKQAEQEGYMILKKPLDAATLHSILTRWLAPA
jgi:DNA-binding NtrC family response regulator